MANVKTTVDGLANVIAQMMQDYTEEIEQGMKKAQEKVAKEGAEQLKGTSPVRTGKYAKAWKAKEQDGGWVIYNTKGQLTHLLEKGHALRNGGRSKAIVHIEPTEQKVIEQYEKEVIRVIQNG